MNWQIAMEIVMGIITFFILCCVGATIELELKKHRDKKKWQEWANRESKRRV